MAFIGRVSSQNKEAGLPLITFLRFSMKKEWLITTKIPQVLKVKVNSRRPRLQARYENKEQGKKDLNSFSITTKKLQIRPNENTRHLQITKILVSS